jgi:sulfoxide reductase heme-binding subunit YedZ
MSQTPYNPELPSNRNDRGNLKPLLVLLASAAFIAGLYLVTISLPGTILAEPLNQLFALDSQQIMWYITRAAGFTSYILLWFSSVWGLAISSKITDAVLHRAFTYDFHQFISLLAIVFIFIHILVLLVDRYLPYTVAQILIPFLSPYRPIWVGIGVIGFYLTLLVTVTFYLRRHIGLKAFRFIHISSLAAYLFSSLHAFFAGTDSSLGFVQLMYAGTFLVMVFLTTYWIVWFKQNKRQLPVKAQAPQPASPRRNRHSHATHY